MKRILILFTVLMLSGFLALAQTHLVRGHVTGPDGNPIQGITIQDKGSNIATASDANGQFEITVPANSTLVFTGVGFEEQSIKIANRTQIDVTLASSTKRLNEVVVTALGIRRQEKSLGYSTKTVNSNDLNISKPVTIGEGLTGKVAGLQINTVNNGVNPGIRVVLRGYRHLNADNQALIVVDGIAVRNDFLSSINPNDVESVTVLKGASAAALYGVDATNGVLVITTKKGGERGKPVIEFNNTTMLERVSYMPPLQNQYAPGSGETGPYPWAPPSFAPDQNKVYYFQNPYTGENQYVPYENQNFGMEFNGDPNLAYIGGPGPDSTFFRTPFKGINPDPRRAFFQTGYRIQNNLTYSGGDLKNSYFLSLQDVSTKGVVPHDQGRRTSLYISGRKTYGRFSAQYNLSYAQQYSNTAGPDFAQGRPVYWNLLNQGANVPLNDPRLKDPNSPYFLDLYYNGYYPNPWWQIYNSRVINRTNYFTGVLQLNFQATDWLNLMYRIGTQFTDFYNSNTIASAGYSPFRIADSWQTSGTYPAHVNGQASYTNANARNISQDFIATLHKKFGDIDATLILGSVVAEKPYANNYSSQTNVSSNQLFVDNFYNTDYRIGELNGSHYINQTRLLSGYGDLTLGFRNMLFLHGSFRRDWSSLLPKGSNAYNFWAADASWVFTEAIKSLQNQDLVSYGKLRVAYSNTGDITLSPYNVQNVFDVPNTSPYPLGNYPYGSQAGITLDPAYRNPSLKPETTVEKEVGIELGLFNSRITLDADYYHSLTSGQTFPVTVSGTTGYTSAYVNAGDVMSEGVEVGINATVLQNNASRFKWDLGGTFSWNGSNVQSLYGDSKDFPLPNGGYSGLVGSVHAVVGQPFPVIETVDLKRDPQGRVIINPSTGYPILGDTLQIVGQVNPKYMLNLNTTISWKNFSLNIQASYRGGNQFFAYVGQQLNFTGASKFTTQNGRQRFIYPNSVIAVLDASGNVKGYDQNTQYYTKDGNADFWTQSAYSQAGTSYIESAAFWKIRNVSLTYDFKDLVQNIHWLHGLTFSLIGKNLLMFRPSQNVWTDPEFSFTTGNAQGITNYDQLPPTRQFGASLNVKF